MVLTLDIPILALPNIVCPPNGDVEVILARPLIILDVTTCILDNPDML